MLTYKQTMLSSFKSSIKLLITHIQRFVLVVYNFCFFICRYPKSSVTQIKLLCPVTLFLMECCLFGSRVSMQSYGYAPISVTCLFQSSPSSYVCPHPSILCCHITCRIQSITWIMYELLQRNSRRGTIWWTLGTHKAGGSK